MVVEGWEVMGSLVAMAVSVVAQAAAEVHEVDRAAVGTSGGGMEEAEMGMDRTAGGCSAAIMAAAWVVRLVVGRGVARVEELAQAAPKRDAPSNAGTTMRNHHIAMTHPMRPEYPMLPWTS